MLKGDYIDLYIHRNLFGEITIDIDIHQLTVYLFSNYWKKTEIG